MALCCNIAFKVHNKQEMFDQHYSPFKQLDIWNTWKIELIMHELKWQLISHFTLNVCEAILRL